MQEIRVDVGYNEGLNEWLQQNTTIRLNVIEKPPGQKGFVVIPKRWVVERSIAWAGRNRWERRIIIRRNNRLRPTHAIDCSTTHCFGITANPFVQAVFQ